MLIFRPELLKLKNVGINAVPSSAFFTNKDRDAEKTKAESIIEEIINENNCSKVFCEELISLKLSELFIELFRENSDYFSLCEKNRLEKGETFSLEPMQRAIKYIEQNYQLDLSLELTADKAGLSPYYFSRLFKKTTGTNYNVYLNQVRVDNAEYLIKTTDEHIIDIAYQTGFKSIRTFNRVFKSFRGIPPQSIRKEI
jgi:AraC-like DNA-binding protein